MSKYPELDKYWPPCGPCALCGHEDKRHRIWDAIIHMTDDVYVIAALYEVPVEAIQLVKELKPYMP